MFAHPTRTLTAAAAIAVGLVLATAPAAGASHLGDTQPPAAPTNVHATAVDQSSVTLAWNPSTDNVAVTQYAAWTQGLPVQYVTGTSARIPGLHPGTTYTFKVEATDGRNWSLPGTAVVTTVPDTSAPTAPSGLALANSVYGQPFDGVTASTALLSWTNSSDDFGPISYQVLVNGVPSPNVFDTRAPGTPIGAASTMWVRHLTPATTYTLTVRAVDGGGNVSAPSNALTVTTDPSADTTAPTAPTLTYAFDGGPGQCPEELWMTFTGSTDPDNASTGIEYEIRVNGTIIDIARMAASGSTGWVSYTGIPGTNRVTLVATDTAGNASAPSNAIDVPVAITDNC